MRPEMAFLEDWSAATLRRVCDVTPTIRLFELDSGDRNMRWSPGAHIRVRLPIGAGLQQRSYSLIDDGSDDGLVRIAVKRCGAGSRALWALGPGDAIDIAAPENRFALGPDAASYTLVAGGVGITPLLGMARRLAAEGRALRLIHSVRNREEAAFAGLLQAWLGDRYALHVSAEAGRLDFAGLVANIGPGGELYVCGPISMLETARAAWQAAARQPASLRFESFASGGHHASQPFVAVLPQHGREVEVAAGQSLLEALEAAGIETLSGCRRGECGVCTLDILSCDAPIDHRDVFLSEAQKAGNRSLCACVSRPVGGRVVLDTRYRGDPSGR